MSDCRHLAIPSVPWRPVLRPGERGPQGREPWRADDRDHAVILRQLPCRTKRIPETRGSGFPVAGGAYGMGYGWPGPGPAVRSGVPPTRRTRTFPAPGRHRGTGPGRGPRRRRRHGRGGRTLDRALAGALLGGGLRGPLQRAGQQREIGRPVPQLAHLAACRRIAHPLPLQRNDGRPQRRRTRDAPAHPARLERRHAPRPACADSRGPAPSRPARPDPRRAPAAPPTPGPASAARSAAATARPPRSPPSAPGGRSTRPDARRARSPSRATASSARTTLPAAGRPVLPSPGATSASKSSTTTTRRGSAGWTGSGRGYGLPGFMRRRPGVGLRWDLGAPGALRGNG